MKKVAITGILSCGKSSICRFFQELGAHVVSADDVVHELLSKNSEVQQQVLTLLGGEIVTQEALDRRKIADKVFKQPELLKELEKIIHPFVTREIERQYTALQAGEQQSFKLFVAEIPLLFEGDSQSDNSYDAVIAVVSDREACKARFCKKTGLPEEEFERRMSRQLSQEEKASRADIVIDNNGSLEELRSQTEAVYHQLVSG